MQARLLGLTTIVVLLWASSSCDDGPAEPGDGIPPPPAGLVPLTDMDAGMYRGRYQGGL